MIQTLQEHYPSLSSQEKKVAAHILKNSEDIQNITITELSEVTQTSPATITRFTKKIGCESFVDFKIQLQATPAKEIEDIQGTQIEQEIYKHYSKVIAHTREMNEESSFDAVVKDIKNARKVYVYGVGSSGFTAQEFVRRLLRMGIDASAITDSHLMLIVSTLITSEDLAIGISTSGETDEIVASLKVAKVKNARIVGLTSFAKSSLALVSDLLLLSYNSMFVDNQRFINSQFSIVFLIDIICMQLLREKPYRESMNTTITTVLEKYPDLEGKE